MENFKIEKLEHFSKFDDTEYGEIVGLFLQTLKYKSYINEDLYERIKKELEISYIDITENFKLIEENNSIYYEYIEEFDDE